MFYKKKIILTTSDNRVFCTVDISQKESNLLITAQQDYDLAIYYKGEVYNSPKSSDFTLKNYQGGELHVAILDGNVVIATGSTEGNHIPSLFTRENKKTKEKDVSPLPPVENVPQKSEKVIENAQQVTSNIEDISNAEQEDIVIESKINQDNSEKSNTVEPIIENKVEQTSNFDLKKSEKSSNVHEFYCSIKPNLDEMLTCYPREEKLCSLIDESSWVKVERDDGYYSVGLVKNNGAPEYICYAVPGREDDTPPDHLKDYCVWIPTDEDSNGYWTVFQDAKTGITIKKQND